MEKSPTALREEEMLAFWQREKVFDKSLSKKFPKGEFIFYDGPPFANGLPRYRASRRAHHGSMALPLG